MPSAMTKKFIKDFKLVDKRQVTASCHLLKLSPADGGAMPSMLPGQFVQVEVAGSKNTFLRRPISVNFIDSADNTLWLLVRCAGEGTVSLVGTPVGATINLVLPLGNGFNATPGGSRLLIGGGVGVAPLLYLGKVLHDAGTSVTFLLGARSADDLALIDEFEKYGTVCISTEDGSRGERGFVTMHSVMNEPFDLIQCCGPIPMMKAVARKAKESGTPCEVSLENLMACGIGACLCCVEDTTDAGNVCVCKEGPVFNIDRLKW